MNTAFMVNALKLHDWIVELGLQHSVISASVWMCMIHGAAESIYQKLCGFINIWGIAVNRKCTKARVVHMGSSDYETVWCDT